MRRRPISIALTFPLLITGIVLATSALLVWAAYQHFATVLRDAAGARLRSSSNLLAAALSNSYAAAAAQTLAVANSGTVRAYLRTGADRESVDRVAAGLLSDSDAARLQLRMVDRDGVERFVARAPDVTSVTSWFDSDSTVQHKRAPTSVRFSPLLDAGGAVQYEIIAPVHARADGESLIGYVIETRQVRARGVDAVRGLIGVSAMLMGQPDSGIWTDFEGVARPPSVPVRTDSILSLTSPGGRPFIGIAHAINGSPMVVWLELGEDRILAPLHTFVGRMVPITIFVAMLGALFAWLFSRRIANRIVTLAHDFDDVNADLSPAPLVRDRGLDELQRLEESFRLMSQRAEKQAQLESQLMQSQKLEAVGRLAGGIAHDFNNMLTVVGNYSEIVRGELEPESPLARDMDEIIHATTHAAQLTRQLLAFSRRQILQPLRLDLNAVIRNAHRLLQRVLPSHVEFRLELDDRIGTVLADPGQIEQVLMNLTVNASDAMPRGGRLTFRTTVAELDESGEPSGNVVARARRHVCLTVVDTGIGMDRETISRIFEPFFTTKPVGKGTGLGLAGVHGIVTQLGGTIWVYSEPGKGTTFKLYFPEVAGAADPIARTPTPPVLEESGTVLLVEDDPATREVAKRLLERHGFDTILAADGRKAIELLEQQHARIRLVLSDVMMPGMNGIELAALIGKRWPAMPVLLMSGYTDAELHEHGDAGIRRPLIEKPFTSAALLDAMLRALYTTEDVLRSR